MKTIVRWLIPVGLLVVLWAQANPAQAAPPVIDGDVFGIELCPQSVCGGALFVFMFSGDVDGAPRTGWGWIEVTHGEPLPGPGASVPIFDGNGTLWVGWSRFGIGAIQGELSGFPEDLFGINVSADIRKWWGPSGAHVFAGWLSHQTFPPTIGGSLAPAGE